MKICLLDDSNHFREMMEDFLKEEGYDVVGYDKLPETKITADVFFIDWNLGGITAEESIITIRNDNRTGILLMLTGNILSTELKKVMIGAGADGIIRKPIDPDDIISLLNSIEYEKWKESKLISF